MTTSASSMKRVSRRKAWTSGLLATLGLGLGTAGLQSAEGARPQRARRGRLVHVVSFKFKEDATKEQIREVVQAFAALKDKIPEIATFEWGTNVSPENLNKGFTHCFVLTFQDEKARDAYLVHPEHKAFGKLVGPVLADVFVIDYLARRK